MTRSIPSVLVALLPALGLWLVWAPQDDGEPAARALRSVRPADIPRPEPGAFARYWHSGKAEITRFALEQSRYGEVRQGDAVMIFVTEDFRTDLHVKAERPHEDAVPVLKLNFTRKFLTGIYPYSTMTSVFTPIALDAPPATLKTTTSVQEWCGHVWQQLDLRGERYELVGHSYFEGEAEERRQLPRAQLEDGLWNRIRLAPWSLPIGELQAVPATLFSRLRHVALAAVPARASLHEQRAESAEGPRILRYRLEMPSISRALEVEFEARFPYRITGFVEELPDGQRSRASPTHRRQLAYWEHNRDQGRALRPSLGLDAGR